MSSAEKSEAVKLHYEDFAQGETRELGSYHVTADEIVAFAREFDPQPFHLDNAAAKQSILGGLCASGWHVCAIIMRMTVDGFLGRTAGMGSSGVDEVKWLKPVFAGETVSGRITVLTARRSAKRPEMGILAMRAELLGEDGTLKCEQQAIYFVKVRAP
jgi:acyl dehydratase